MRNAKGFGQADLMITAGVVLALVLLVAGALFYVAHERAAGKEEGVTEEKGRWQAREAQELATANAEILRLQAAMDELERRLIREVANLEEKNRREMKDAERQKDADVAAARAGTLALRVPCKPAGGQGPGVNTAAGAVAAASGPDGAGTTELPRETTASLFSLANDADRIARKVGRLQDLVLVYYRACTGETKNPVKTGFLDVENRLADQAELRDGATPERLDFLPFLATITLPVADESGGAALAGEP